MGQIIAWVLACVHASVFVCVCVCACARTHLGLGNNVASQAGLKFSCF